MFSRFAEGIGSALVGAVEGLKEKNLHLWLPGYGRHAIEDLLERGQGLFGHGTTSPRHLMFAFCDHFEPLWHKPTGAVGKQRVQAWVDGYPAMAREFRDADGRPPRHSFFFPGEEYAPEYLDGLASLARAGLGEVEFHLHHDGDTAAKLRDDIHRYLELFARHGHLSRDHGRLRYAFIHGNWCLANARPDGRWCGVDDEIPLLFETGCYADFTFPAAPDVAQPGRVNQIYWPVGDLARRRAYEQGERAKVGERKRDRLLIVEGPLAVALRRGRRMPLAIETGAVTASDPAVAARVATWVRQNIHVAGRPEWVFVKVHTHGAPEAQAASLLGEGGRAMHRELTARYNDGRTWALHYVTAREMFNIASAAMDGKDGDPNLYRNYVLPPPPVAAG